MSDSLFIDDFRNSFKGGTRQNRFSVTGNIGAVDKRALNATESLLVKAAQFPPSTVGIIPVPFRGRIAKIPGDRQYLEWQISILDDASSALYKAFQDWSSLINSHFGNKQDPTWTDTADALGEWEVTHLDLEGNPIKKVTLKNCWPVEVGSIDLSYDAVDTVVEFPVTIAYDYFIIDRSVGAPGLPNAPQE
jgi:hypothetical protein|tara:strand:- start:833 stop:1405 length:573 start_codon:yes stop_codon:yes gene_type:complete